MEKQWQGSAHPTQRVRRTSELSAVSSELGPVNACLKLERIGLVCRFDMQNLENLLTYNAESNIL